MNEVIEIKGIRQSEDGTEMLILAPEKNLFDTILDKRIKVAEMRLDDGRTISVMQRKKAYATIRDMAEWTVYPP